VTDTSRSSRDGAANTLTNPVSDALWDQLLPKLALALQENAALAEAAGSGTRSNINSSKDSSSSVPPAAASASSMLRLLQLVLAIVVGVARSIVAFDHFVVVAEPAARLAMAALAGAAAQDAAVASGIVTTCTQLGRMLMPVQLSDIFPTEQSDSEGTGQGVCHSAVGASRWHHHMRKLQSSPHYAQLMLVNLAGYTQGVLQVLPPADGSGSSSSSASSGGSPSSSSSSSSTHICPEQHAGSASQHRKQLAQ
jgi:hypothetical protein